MIVYIEFQKLRKKSVTTSFEFLSRYFSGEKLQKPKIICLHVEIRAYTKQEWATLTQCHTAALL
jgi:hypothetical protein